MSADALIFARVDAIASAAGALTRARHWAMRDPRSRCRPYLSMG